MPHPGEVYYLPPQEGERTEPGKGDRPFVLLSLGSTSDDVSTLAYCSTQQTEALHGAAHVLVGPGGSTGFSRPTYVYPSRLASYVPEALGASSGRVTTELAAIRRALTDALGIGTGLCTDLDVPRGSRRGCIVAFSADYIAMTGFSHGLVITEPRYSRHGRLQTIVPFLRAADYEPGSLDVLCHGRQWIADALGMDQPVNLATSLVATVFESDWVAQDTGVVIDLEPMRTLEDRLLQHFGLDRRPS